jgi:hypothetical protein
MNFDWIISPLTIYGVFAAGGVAALHLVLSTKIEMHRQQKHGLAETESLREAIDTLKGKVQEVSVEVAALHLVLSTRIEMRRQQKHGLAETESLREAIDAPKDKVQEVSVEVKQNTPPPVVFTPFTELNVQNRAEALRMYQQGSGSRAISAALGLPPAEVALLEKVHNLLSGGSDGAAS